MSNNKTAKTRIYLFDNLKGSLIFLVVLLHYLGTGFVYTNSSNYFIDAIYAFNATFHMPLFIFISGYFSKNIDKARDTAFSKVLFPYLFFNTIFILLNGQNINQILKPNGVMWYLIALFFWRILLKDLIKIRYILIISIVIGLASRFIFKPDNFILIKIASLSSFFILGYLTNLSAITRIRRIPKKISWVTLCISFIIITTMSYSHNFPYSVPLFTKSLEFGRVSNWWFSREIFSLVIGVVISICTLNLISDKKTIFSKVGVASLTVYLFHSFPYLRETLFLVNPVKHNFYLSFAYWVSLSIIVTIVLSSNIFTVNYQKMVRFLFRTTFRHS